MIILRFVTFVTEADARTALALIKNKQFNGNTIKARLKTETMNKSYFRYLSFKNISKLSSVS